MAESCKRLSEIRCYIFDDKPFYRLRDVLDALDVPRNTSTRSTASSWIDPSHKRYEWVIKRTRRGKTYRDKRFCYIDRAGVERLILRYGGKIPRSEYMNALPALPV